MKKEDLIVFLSKYIKVFTIFAFFALFMFVVYAFNTSSPSFVSVGLIVLLVGFSAGVAVSFFAINNMIKELNTNE